MSTTVDSVVPVLLAASILQPTAADRVVLLGPRGVLPEVTHDELVNRDADYRELVLG